ncbi:DUF934 domain-containing protein [Celeribacter litoreus]|uniref:DUF934 domain-containing protein n=1 Tax=Celeribacter litoreus TaxID=2876714 RepID=UPI001CCDC853|nr:DUF934 domain-containing protein [Celeribacter litoreus]MCA0043557.1 DUF934 domain-containing protein [Celeribacter litoreus]
MTVIIRDEGFVSEDYHAEWVTLASDTDPATLSEFVNAPAIRVEFPSFADGRGFTLGRLLRTNGFQGRLRATGHVIADQYAMARRSGFDEVEVSKDLAERQPEAQWLARADWRAHDYQTRLRQAR